MNKPDFLSSLDLPKILGRPYRGIIFSDLDGVWLDEQNNFAFPRPETLESIRLARERGYWVVLNSDTAPETLANFAAQLGANSWVIAENGGVISVPKVGSWYLSAVAPFIATLRSAAIELLADQKINASIWQGDATPFIQRGEKIPSTSEGQVAYLINTMRTCSIGIYTRVIGPDGSLRIDDVQTQQTEDILNNILTKQNLQATLVCRRYPNLGSCLIKDPTIIKASAVKRIIEQFGRGLSYWMIGDRVYDSMKVLGRAVLVGAVANADAELKTEAADQGIVSPAGKTIADGANYIIREILRKEEL